jgi:predicted O-methyltransferase YrrM
MMIKNINRSAGFDFENIYRDMVKKYDNAIFVEVGCFEGGSTVYMAELIKRSGKNIKFYAVDLFEKYKPTNGQVRPSYKKFKLNTLKFAEYIKVLKMDSLMASKRFADKTIDFVFLDADHAYKSVKNDIKYWMPKVKDSGTLAGHDYAESKFFPGVYFPGVSKAVNIAGFDFYVDKSSWIKK